MTYSKVGDCPHCGAPIYVPSIWNGTVPPAPMYTCNCRPASQHNINTSATRLGFWPPKPNPPIPFTETKSGPEALAELFKQLPKGGEEAISELVKQFPGKSRVPTNERLAALESKVEEILQILTAPKNGNKRKRKSKRTVLKG